MAYIKNQIISGISIHIRKCDADLRRWYVGITANPRKRLFDGHNVWKDGDAYVSYKAKSNSVAREVEKYFIRMGAQGGSGGGNANSRFVYAYRIEPHTRE